MRRAWNNERVLKIGLLRGTIESALRSAYRVLLRRNVLDCSSFRLRFAGSLGFGFHMRRLLLLQAGSA